MSGMEVAVVKDAVPPILHPEMRHPLESIISQLDVKSACHLMLTCHQLLEFGRHCLAKVPLEAEGLFWNGHLHLQYHDRRLNVKNVENLPLEVHVKTFHLLEIFPSCHKFSECLAAARELRVKTIEQVIAREFAVISGRHMEKLIMEFRVQKLYVEHPLPLDCLLGNVMQRLRRLEIHGLEPFIADTLLVMSQIPEQRLPSTTRINPLVFAAIVNQWFRADRNIRSVRFLAAGSVSSLYKILISSAWRHSGAATLQNVTWRREVYLLKRLPNNDYIFCHLYYWQFDDCYVRLTRHEQ